MPGFVMARHIGTTVMTRPTLSMLMSLAPSDLIEITHQVTTLSSSHYGSGFAGLHCSQHLSQREIGVGAAFATLALFSSAALGHMPTLAVPETPPVPFAWPASFPLPVDTMATTSGRPPSERAVSDDLDIGFELEVSVGLAEALENPDAVMVGPLERTSNFPYPPSPSEACTLEEAVANTTAALHWPSLLRPRRPGNRHCFRC